jgi:hypothetical protein
MSNKKASIIGWFGQGAFADDLIGAVTEEHFQRLGYETHSKGWPRKNELVKFMSSFDDIIIGGGSIICPTRMHPINTTNIWYPKVKKPLHLFGSGFRKESSLLSEHEKRLNGYIFSSLSTSWLRGYITEKELLKNGIKREHDGFGDPGILFKNTNHLSPNGPSPHLGIVIRNIPEKEIHYSENRLIHKFFIRFIKKWISVYKGSVHYISFRHVFPELDCDYFAMSYVKSVIGYENQFLYKPKDYLEAANLITSMDHCVSQRLHPTIISLANNVRCVGLDYQFRKLEDFSSVVGFDYWHRTDQLSKETAGKTLDWLSAKDYSKVFCTINTVREKMKDHLKKTFG